MKESFIPVLSEEMMTNAAMLTVAAAPAPAARARSHRCPYRCGGCRSGSETATVSSAAFPSDVPGLVECVPINTSGPSQGARCRPWAW